jgi:hypothetical protein
MRMVSSEPKESDISLDWQGTRMEVELPISASKVKKNIVPEMIN